MDDAEWDRQRRSFGTGAEVYDRARPRYATEAIVWAVGDRPCRVLDLGAGTGILTRQLAELGHRVSAVEPDEQMLGRLRAAVDRQLGSTAAEHVRSRLGSAEQIPLPDASVDVVMAGQSYHWFDPGPAHDEIARVLVPGGVFAPIWNLRDDSVGWVADLTRIVASADTTRADGVGYRSVGLRFGPVERAAFAHAVSYTPDGLVELVQSRSYYLTADPQQRAQLEADVRALVDSHPDLAGRSSFELPYQTVVYRTRLVGDPGAGPDPG